MYPDPRGAIRRRTVYIFTHKTVLNSRSCQLRIEDDLFDRGRMRSAMASKKSKNIYILKYFMAVRNCINIFVLC